jgi:acyl carrier protein
MERDKLFDIVRDIAVDVLGVDASTVTESASFKADLGADSLDLVELVMALEERFDITIPEEQLEGITTVGQALDFVAA